VKAELANLGVTLDTDDGTGNDSKVDTSGAASVISASSVMAALLSMAVLATAM
jgi:NifU-like protein involved in Fe-S cluster formation